MAISSVILEMKHMGKSRKKNTNQ